MSHQTGTAVKLRKMEGGAMSMIKDIPGYRVILRAVLKGQIQYLVSP